MLKKKVVVAYCDNYEYENVHKVLSYALNELGGIEQFVSKEEKILIKPNFLYPSNNDSAITTHPSIIEAMLAILEENNFTKVKIGDSSSRGNVPEALKKANLTEEKLHGASVAYMNEEANITFKDGAITKNLTIAKDAMEADAIIGLCKMKTHMLERITGALKNMYGLIPGLNKAKGHMKYNTALKFAGLLCDIHKATPQRLHVMDGIIAMEGNGPASGTPTDMNLILVSNDPIALDSIFARLVYLAPEMVPTIVEGQINRLGTSNFDEIEITLLEGDKKQIVSIDELVNKYGKRNFDVNRNKEKMNILTLWSRINGGQARPIIDSDKCVKCGVCVSHCPVEGKAVDFKNGKNNPPVYDYRKCIRCYCCQELCPQHAISVKR